MTQGQPDASGKMEACPKCGQAEYYKVTPSGERLCAICGTNLKDRPTPSADADRVREQLERQRAENAKLQRAILHPHEQINPAPKTYGMKKVAYGDEILAELPEGQYVKLEDYRELARHFLKRGAEIERLEAAEARVRELEGAAAKFSDAVNVYLETARGSTAVKWMEAFKQFDTAHEELQAALTKEKP